MSSELLNRNLVILVLAQAAAVTGTVALVTLGGIVGRDLAPTATLSTLPISLQVVGTAAATVFAAWTMSRIGRAYGFALGAAMGAFGAAVAVVGVLDASFVVFCAGAMLVGVANAFSQQYRFAAAESVSSRSAGYAISITLAGSMIGAVAGPELAARGEDWISGTRYAGTFVAVVGCYLVAAVLLLGLRSKPVSRVAEPAVDVAKRRAPAVPDRPPSGLRRRRARRGGWPWRHVVRDDRRAARHACRRRTFVVPHGGCDSGPRAGDVRTVLGVRDADCPITAASV